MKKLYIFGALACLFSACKPSVNITVPPTAGDADFRSYLAIGNSLTAGYSDNSLTVTGQLNSYPQRLFEQFALIQDRGAQGNFYQPLLATDMGYPGPRKELAIVYYCNGDSSVAPIDLSYFSASADDAKAYSSPGPNGQINNIGVPGIRVADYNFAGYAALNKYAARFYKSPNTATPQQELEYRVSNNHPTFFTMWLGANDVLGYAVAGGQGDGSGNAAPIAPNLYNRNDITPTPIFDTNYSHAVMASISTGAKGALINIPDITKIPFFTTIPANGLVLTRQSQADSLTAFYSSLNYVFQLGKNYFIVRDNLGNLRQAVPGELILLTTPKDSITCAGWGSYKAIPQSYVLTTEEIQNIKNATTRFNEKIAGYAFRNNLALVDMFSYMSTIESGIVYNGIKYNSQFVTGGAFSLDGVHMNPRGYAIIANKIIETINTKYHSTISPVNVNKYSGILFPGNF